MARQTNMSWCCCLIFLLSLFQTCSSSPKSCLNDQRSALLQFKQMHSIGDQLGSWKSNTDCCYWKGVTCDGSTGLVVGLDLSDSSLSGSIYSNSSLFHLYHLEILFITSNGFSYFAPSGFDCLSRLAYLKLSMNSFSGRIPLEISRLRNLVSLDLSFNRFEGQVPSEISKLTKLLFLDLSNNIGLKLENTSLRELFQNLSSLRELRLDGVNMSTAHNIGDWCQDLSSALPKLRVLSMVACSLKGPMDVSISNLHFLSEVYLGGNRGISSTVPSSLMNLTSLAVVSLPACGLYGEFPSNVFLQPNLKVIDLSGNLLLSGHLPEFPPRVNAIQELSVAYTKFSGTLPNSIGNLKSLEVLWLWNSNFSGPIPASLANLTHLIHLGLSSNSFSGQIPPSFKGSFPNLEGLHLGSNVLQGNIHSDLFFLPSLKYLDLSQNQFSGIISEPSHNINSSFFRLSLSDLSGNHLKGEDITRSLSKMKGTFEELDLSFNDFSYTGEEDTNLLYDSGDHFANVRIGVLSMSSCNISKFPDFLRDHKELANLDLSNNRMDGAIPKWIWQENLFNVNVSHNLLTTLELPLPVLSELRSLDLHSNMIRECFSTAPCFPCTFNHCPNEFTSFILGNLTSLISGAYFFSISDNELIGKIPSSICNASVLSLLDLSNNQLTGTIPTCLASGLLDALNLENNNLQGHIPPHFTDVCHLLILKLNRNMLQGEVPRSLANCTDLEVLDIGENQLNDTFPFWLENLSQLKVLVMRSNNFSGPIGELSHFVSPFPSLHVIDISFNKFTGNLPLEYIRHWKGMMEDISNFDYINLSGFGFYYQVDLAVMNKGRYVEMQSILTTFTSVDFSNNKFEGSIPDAMGALKSLIVLNLSGNGLTGQIPSSMENLSNLESLDLSRNNLSGGIPWQLKSLTFLSVLNLSNNHLTGSIPQGNQFDTFSNTSYEGNAGLCGLPLSKKCGIIDRAMPPALMVQQHEDSTFPFDWKFVLAGYCSGLIIGVVIGQELFWRNNGCFEFSRGVPAQRRSRRRIQRGAR